MTRVLVVDDSTVDRVLTGKLLELGAHWQVTYAADAADALEHLGTHQPDVVVTDLHMPEIDGLQLVERIRREYPQVPVVLITAQGNEQLAIDALRAGAAYYLPKHRLSQDLVDTVSTVVATAQASRQHEQLMDRLDEAEWSFVLGNDTSLIPTLVEHARIDLARLQPCDETSQTRLGIALHEALVNAIDHGNLELCSDLRERDDHTYHDLARLRAKEPPYCTRRVFVTFKATRNEAQFTVRDEGPGFDPSTLPDPTDPANLERVCGRGLLLIRTFMDEVRHNSTGNEITMIKRRCS